MDKFKTCIWYDDDAEAAARFYCDLFPDSGVDAVSRAASDYPGGKQGDALVVDFHLGGRGFMGLNGHMRFEFTPAMSIQVDCADQAEVDRYWDALTADGGKAGNCGWCQDRWGVQWQIVPRRLQELLNSPDRDAAKRAMEAMLKMDKIDVAGLEAAAAG